MYLIQRRESAASFRSRPAEALDKRREAGAMAKKICFSLSAASVRAAQQEIRNFQQDLLGKCEILCQRLAQEGIQVAQAHISGSGFRKYIRLSSEITPERAGCRAVLYMEDSSETVRERQTPEGVKIVGVSPVLMLEFGSGLRTESPDGILGVGAGALPGRTHEGNSHGWRYMDLDGMWHDFGGANGKMPMYFAGKEMQRKIVSIAKEVFGAKINERRHDSWQDSTGMSATP